MTEVGISLGVSPREPMERFVRLVKAAEARGVADAVWVIDSQMAMKDAYVALGLIAHETSRIKLGPGVTNLVTRHETVVANAMNTLAAVAPGRVLVGVGSGDSSVFPIGRKPLTVAETDTRIRRLQALLRGDSVPGDAGDLRLSFSPDPPPPVYLAASQPRMLRLAGSVADGVIIMGPADRETVDTQLAEVERGARDSGRDPAELKRDLWVTMAIGPDGSAVQDVKSWGSAQARWLARWKQVPRSLERFRPEMERAAAEYDFGSHLSRQAEHASTISDEFAKLLAIAGTLEECRDRLRPLVDAAVDRVTLTLLSGGRERRLDEIAELRRALT